MKQIFQIGILILGLLLFDIGCPIRYLLHFPCPACGITRAWISAFQGDWESAFAYHPLFLLVPIFLLYACTYDRMEEKRYDGLIKWSALLFFLVYITRLIRHTIP